VPTGQNLLLGLAFSHSVLNIEYRLALTDKIRVIDFDIQPISAEYELQSRLARTDETYWLSIFIVSAKNMDSKIICAK
jgi:hypothetical protein